MEKYLMTDNLENCRKVTRIMNSNYENNKLFSIVKITI